MLYNSTKSFPYVYMGIHKETGKIYIGYRESHVRDNISSSDDLGIRYFTSGKISKSTFNEYTWHIVAEFFNAVDAYWAEQSLIKEYWGNPLLMNKQFYDEKTTKGIFRHTSKTVGFTGRKHSDETKAKMSIPLSDETKALISSKVAGKKHPNYGKHLSPETRAKMSAARKNYAGENHPCYGKPRSDETKAKLSAAFTGRIISSETKAKMKEAAKHKAPQSIESRLRKSESLKRYHAEKKLKD